MSLILLLASAAAYTPHVGTSGRITTGRASRPAVLVAASPAETNPQNFEKGGIGTHGSERPEGSHGTGFRFMPLDSMSSESSPVLMCLAGAYPGLTAEQLLAPTPLPFAVPGKWTYHRLTGDAVPTGFVVLPGSALLDMNPNTVGVVCQSDSLGLELPDNKPHEVIALIERTPVAPADFDSKQFYAFADPQGTISIRWMNALPEGWSIVGRLVYTQLPYVQKPGGKSGFAEYSDDFAF